MDFERLGEVWRRQPGPERERPANEDIAAVRARAAALDHAVRRRDRIETGVSLVMLPYFVWLALTLQESVSVIGAAIVAGACVLIPIRLYLARRRRPTDPGLPVADAVRAELKRIRAQERLLGSALWWYFVPIGAGVILLGAGSQAPTAFKVAYAVVIMVAYGWLVRLNHRAASEQFAPVARRLKDWLANLDEPLDDGVSHAN